MTEIALTEKITCTYCPMVLPAQPIATSASGDGDGLGVSFYSLKELQKFRFQMLTVLSVSKQPALIKQAFKLILVFNCLFMLQSGDLWLSMIHFCDDWPQHL